MIRSTSKACPRTSKERIATDRLPGEHAIHSCPPMAGLLAKMPRCEVFAGDKPVAHSFYRVGARLHQQRPSHQIDVSPDERSPPDRVEAGGGAGAACCTKNREQPADSVRMPLAGSVLPATTKARSRPVRVASVALPPGVSAQCYYFDDEPFFGGDPHPPPYLYFDEDVLVSLVIWGQLGCPVTTPRTSTMSVT